MVAKERHVLFVQDVKKVREDVNFKLQELREDMEKKYRLFELSLIPSTKSLLPTTYAPPASTGVQGGENIFACSKTGGEDSKVVGRLFSSKIRTTKPIMATAGQITSTVVTTVPITKPKGIVIGKTGDIGGSASKPRDDVVELVQNQKVKIF
ncbi:unnamed protein product [Lactuca saligna]|uniref:Uncharacterized protein n=1 Tax=Lactuca saligna TaxID=75948 RepID=A0AA35ZQV3_LACSI|nr:unnamed protein product [Lactuca saligna]